MNLTLAIIGTLLIAPFAIFMMYYLFTGLIDIFTYSGHGARVLQLATIACIGIICVSMADAATYRYSTGLTIEAPDFKTAAKRCFYILNYKYTTEERGLEVIDICANPVKGEVK
jgi:hypothetical protein